MPPHLPSGESQLWARHTACHDLHRASIDARLVDKACASRSVDRPLRDASIDRPPLDFLNPEPGPAAAHLPRLLLSREHDRHQPLGRTGSAADLPI